MNQSELQAHIAKRERERQREEVARRFVCSICASPLVTPHNGTTNETELVCGASRSHTGHSKIRSWTERRNDGEYVPVHILDRIEKRERKTLMESTGLSPEKATALQRYQGQTSLSKLEAMDILKTVWPDAPEIEVIKAAWICHKYQLNPLMKHIFLVKYNKYNDKREIVGETWEILQGIKATRLIASRRKKYHYFDGPRIMTPEEQERILGEIDTTKIFAITILQDNEGNRAPGYGNWPKNMAVKGADKGNTKANQAFIRSERAAFDRLCPGEMPEGVGIADEDYIDTDFKEVEQIPETTSEPEKPEPIDHEHFCSEHNVPFKKMEKNGATWYAHKQSTGWCNEAKVKAQAPPPEAEPIDDEPPIEFMDDTVTTPPEPAPQQFKDADALKAWWLKSAWKLTPERILFALGTKSFDAITDLNAAHQILLQKHPM